MTKRLLSRQVLYILVYILLYIHQPQFVLSSCAIFGPRQFFLDCGQAKKHTIFFQYSHITGTVVVLYIYIYSGVDAARRAEESVRVGME